MNIDDWAAKQGLKKGTITIKGYRPRPDRIELAEDEFLLHVTDPACADYVQMGCTRYPDGSTFIAEVHAGHEGRPVSECQATMPELRTTGTADGGVTA